MNAPASLQHGLATVISHQQADIQFQPGALPHVAELLGGNADAYLDATNPYNVTTEMRGLLANGNNPLTLKIRPYFVIHSHTPIHEETEA